MVKVEEWNGMRTCDFFRFYFLKWHVRSILPLGWQLSEGCSGAVVQWVSVILPLLLMAHPLSLFHSCLHGHFWLLNERDELSVSQLASQWPKIQHRYMYIVHRCTYRQFLPCLFCFGLFFLPFIAMFLFIY